MTEICPKIDCTGCHACLNACPTGSITMKEDSKGCIYPQISQDTCIDCGLCQRVCPVCHPIQLYSPQEGFVAYAKDFNEQKTAASGGIASVLSRFFVKKGGAVYGSSAAEPFNVKHIRIVEEADLEQLKGSKYVHSHIGLALKELLNDVKSERDVLFIGTPCQVAGVRSLLRKDFPNFYAIDLICHGVPPQKVLNAAIKYVSGSSYKDVKTVRFRRKDKKGHIVYGLYINDTNGKEVYGNDIVNDFYSIGFMKALFYRPNCYRCKYARLERTGDITLGDFWDKEKKSLLPRERRYGMSMVMANSEKGTAMMKAISENIQMEPGSIDNFRRSNAMLSHPMKEHPFAADFWKTFENSGFSGTENLFMKMRKKMLRQSLSAKLSRIIYKVPYTEYLYSKLFRKSHNK